MTPNSKYDLSEFSPNKSSKYDLSEFAQQQSQEPEMSLGSRMLRDVVAGLGNFATEIPHDVISAGSSLKSLSEKLYPKVAPTLIGSLGNLNPIMAMMTPETSKATDVDWSSQVGINSPNIYDKLIQESPNLAVGGKAAYDVGKLGIRSLKHLGEYLGDKLGGSEVKNIKSSIDAINPEQTAKYIIDNLSGGKTIEQNAQQGAKEIQKGFLKSKLDYKKGVEDILDRHGYIDMSNSDFYKKIVNNSEIKDVLNKSLSGEKSLDYFKKYPLLRNAHALQSDIGKAGSSLWKSAETIGNYNDYNTLKNSREILNKNILDSLLSKDPVSADRYKGLSKDYFDNVVSHTEDPDLRKIVNGDLNDHSEQFTKNYNQLLRKKDVTLGDINNFVEQGNISGEGARKSINGLLDSSHINEALKNAPTLRDIMSSHLMGGILKKKPSQVLSNIENIAQTKSQFLSPELKEMGEKLENDILSKKTLQEQLDLANKKMEGKVRAAKKAVGATALGALFGGGYETSKHFL